MVEEKGEAKVWSMRLVKSPLVWAGHKEQRIFWLPDFLSPSSNRSWSNQVSEQQSWALGGQGPGSLFAKPNAKVNGIREV